MPMPVPELRQLDDRDQLMDDRTIWGDQDDAPAAAVALDDPHLDDLLGAPLRGVG